MDIGGGFGASGVVFAFLVVVWAAYAVPLAVRRSDEIAKTNGVESVGSLSRVIRRTRKVEVTEEISVTAPAARPRITRESARIAARRRRRVLITLLTTLVVVASGAALGYAPAWSVGIPAGLIAAWLIACRIQVRGERGISRARTPRSKSTPRSAADDEETVVLSGQFEDIDPGRKHVMEDVPLEVDALEEKLVIAVPSVSTTGEPLWDPLPVTLPTYVTKPRAGRTVRTIDFGQPGTWTSGHIEGEDTELPAKKASGDDTGSDEKRAVGH